MADLNKKVEVRKIKEFFDLTQVCGNDDSLNRWTIAPDINRPGLELSGYKDGNELKRVVIIGSKEQKYISTLDYYTQLDRFDFLTDAYTPCIIITNDSRAPEALIEVASRKNFPVFEFPGKTYEISTDLVSYLSNKLADSETISGGLMQLYGVGVLIMGDSGIGKSELELDLIKKGHIFVADDVVEISRVNKTIYGKAPHNLKRMLEVRGIGVIDVNLMFGGHCYLRKCHVNFVIKLVNREQYLKNNRDRLSPNEETIDLLGVEKPILEIPVTEGKPMSIIVETAVANYIVKKQGIDTNEMFKNAIYNEIANKR